MEINIKISDQEVLKKVMAGMNEEDIANEIRNKALEICQQKIRPLIEKEINKKTDNVWRNEREKILIQHAKEIKSKINKASLKKLMDTNEFDEIFCNVIWDYVERWLDQNELCLTIKTPRKTKYTPNPELKK